MKTDRLDPKTISQADAERELVERVYEACRIIEDLERAGRVSGNGHHARQKIAAMALEQLKSRWKDAAPKDTNP